MKRLPILTFHSIDSSGSVVSMTRSEFERIMQGLAEAGWRGVTLTEAISAARRSPDERLVALTFDDGYANLRTGALPTLARLGFSATVFVIAGRVGQDNRWPGQPASIPTMDLADWRDLDVLASAGWELGAHGMAHLPLAVVSPELAAREIEESQAVIAHATGRPVSAFAYPYGLADDRARTLAAARYQVACGARLALASELDLASPFELPRIDAHYLRRFPPVALDSPAAGGYLALRRLIRRMRPVPWEAAALPRGNAT